MRGQLALLALVFITFNPPVVRAADLSKDYERCVAATETNFGWGRCLSDEIRRQEKRLADAWQAATVAMKGFTAGSRDLLMKEQAACRALVIADRVEKLKALTKQLQPH